MADHDDLASGIGNLNVNDESPPSNPSEQSYEASRHGNVTHRRRTRESAFHSASNYQQKAVEKTAKSRESFDASHSLRLNPNATHEDKMDYMLQKVQEQEKCMDTLIDAQNHWNKSSEEHLQKNEERLEDFSSTLLELTQTTIRADTRMTEIQASQHAQQKILEELLASQRQQQRQPRTTSHAPQLQFNDRRLSHSSTESLDMLANSNGKEKRFRESDIGYFDSTFSETYGKGDYITIGDKVYYRDVWLFIDSAQAIATTKGSRLIRTNLHRCLRGNAQAWYITELSKLQRSNLHEGHGLRHWEEALAARFKIIESDALALLAEDRYTVEDVRRHRQVSSYVQSVVRHCKDAGIKTVPQQLHWAWSYLDPGLQRDVKRPGTSATILSFIQELEDLQTPWRRYFARETTPRKQWQPQAAPPPQPYNQQPYNQQPANQNYSRGQQYNNRNSNNQGNQYSQNQQQNQRNGQPYTQSRYPSSANQQPQNQMPQPRLIEAPPSRQASWQKSTWNAPTNAAPPAPAYYTNATEEEYQEEVFHGHENEDEHHENEATQPPHSAMAGVFFNDYNQPKYGLAPYSCQQNHGIMTFGNSAELRDHVLDYHGVDTRSAGPKYHTREANYIQHAEEHVYNFSPPSSMGYAMIQASIFDMDLTPCLDTGGGVSLCDRSLLPANQNHSGLVHGAKPITITGVAGMQVLDQYIEQEVLLGPNKIPIPIKAYLVNNLQPGLIIGMDVLNRGDIDLLLSRQALRVGDIEIPLCYTPPSPSANQSNCFIPSANEYEENYYSYHFVAGHTNNGDVTKQKTRKWKPIPSILPGLQNLQNSANHMAMRPSITPEASESEGSILNQAKCSNTKAFATPTIPRQCRRCKQHFTSGNLLHRHIQHCSTGTKGSRQAAMAGKWRKL